MSQARARARAAGFTLIELLVVVGIMLLLASITLPALFGVRRNAAETSCKNNLTQISKGIFAYMVNWDRYLPCNRPPIVPNTQVTPNPSFPRGYDDLSALWCVPTARRTKTGSGFQYTRVWTDRYVGDIRAFNCPLTRDQCGTIPEPVAETWGTSSPQGWWYWKEIRYKRTGKAYTFTWGSGTYNITLSDPDPKAWLSYEYCGEFNPALHAAGIDSSIAWILHDEDANNENTTDVVKNKLYTGLALTSKSNHGKRNGNMIFLDGHAETVPAMDWIKKVSQGIREWERVSGWVLPDEYLDKP